MLQSPQKVNGQSLGTQEGNLVLLHDHSKGINKIQNNYKDQEFVVVGKHAEPKVY